MANGTLLAPPAQVGFIGVGGMLLAPPHAGVPAAGDILVAPPAHAGFIGVVCAVAAVPHADVPVLGGVQVVGEELGVPAG